MSEIIQFHKKAPVEDKCSFCKTPESKVKKLISNSEGKFICNVCVTTCKKLITEEDVS
mgnify:CR=1 FL=1